jgi:hypothetical protein
MINRRRGEAALELAGRRWRLRLTLGALAEMEAAFGANDLGALAERFSAGRLAAGDIVTLLACALRGGGHDVTREDVALLPLDEGGLPAILEALTACLSAAFGDTPPDPPAPQEPRRPSPGTTPWPSASASCGSPPTPSGP